ncbi:NtaA/DmoA family FMN-dependent monooxygenase [Aquibium microcysteis]|uniref:NtaA/DmoA family FMN-dependent monooxygenase n=1 Tax=Aquibium microcysteis TaxID=675281 RepID=UPI00165D030A|nr:NtaA/DmoA family FMN-dependent monooxygenase [Aquibium microcysteis]
MCESESIHLAIDSSFIHTDHLWCTPGSWMNYDYYGPSFYEDLARIAQRGFFDMIFFGDAAETPENFGDGYATPLREGYRWPKHDMMPMISLMAKAAPNLGFGITMSTTYHHPFHVARLFSSLDHVTGGRVGWNAVTSAYKNEAANWGFDTMLPPDERYDIAREHLQVVIDLWNSVEADAILMDRENGIFADPSKVHLINHVGKHFKVRGPLPCLPSRQGRPVVIQAGQSDDGMNLAAKHADMQFVSRRTNKSIAAHRAVLDDLTVKHGRKPRDLGVFWQVRVVAGDTREDAIRKERRFLETLPPNAGLIELSFQFGFDFSRLDGKMKLVDMVDLIKSQKTYWGPFQELLNTEDPDTEIEDLGRRWITERSNFVVGSVKEVADHIEGVHEAGGRNGGIILTKSYAAPGALRDFCELVVPELQRRGLMRTKYTHDTLRGNLNS